LSKGWREKNFSSTITITGLLSVRIPEKEEKGKEDGRNGRNQ
jgi:hypothetical protein